MRCICAALALGLASLAAPVAAAETCTGAPYDSAKDPALAALLARALPVIAGYPSLDRALRAAAPAICLSGTPSEALGYFEPATNRVTIAQGISADLQLAILVHELRHVEQHGRAMCPDTGLAMQEYARATWALEADASAISLIVAWEMRAADEPGPWQALAAWPRQDDIAAAFATAMRAGGDTASAAQAAFAAWYDDPDRREGYYIASCSHYLNRQEETHALPRYGALDEGFFAALCVMPDGTPFPCADPGAGR
jgi:hypothetical protein